MGTFMATQSYAFVRSLQTSAGSNFKDYAQIKSAEAHAKRQDLTSEKRQVEGRSHEDNHFWSKAGEGLEGGGADYAAAYRKHKKDHGVKSERKGAAMGQHLLVGVSPEWLAEGGDPRDINNPRVVQLIDEAKAWAESWMGEGAVWGVRYDTDEKGAGVVDILASPIREQKHRGGSSKPAISVRKANRELAEKHGVMKSYEAMQTDWALHAQTHLDKDLKRGEPKAETKRENVSPEVYAAAVEKGMAETKRQLENFQVNIANLYERLDREDVDDLAYDLNASEFFDNKDFNNFGSGKNAADYNAGVQERKIIKVYEYATTQFLLERDGEHPDFGTYEIYDVPSILMHEVLSLYDMEREEPFKMFDWVKELIFDAFQSAYAQFDYFHNIRNMKIELVDKQNAAKAREEAVTAREKAVVDAETAFEAERVRGYEEGRVEGLTEAAEALAAVEVREEAVSDREAAVAHAKDVSEAWEGLEAAPEPIVQAVNDRMSLFDTVGEVLDGLDLSDNAAYLAKVHPSERDLNGDPPPVRSLVFDRAQTLAQKKNQLVADRHAGRGRAPS
jgi:hypothetical protein